MTKLQTCDKLQLKKTFSQYMINTQMERTLEDLVQEANEAEINLESSSDSEIEEPVPIRPKKTQLYSLSNISIDTAFTEGSILVRVAESTTIYPFHTCQLNSQILFEDDLSNFVVLFKTHSKFINSSSLLFHRLEFFLKPVKGEQFSIQVTNQSQVPIKLLKGISIGHLFLYPFYKNGCKSKKDTPTL